VQSVLKAAAAFALEAGIIPIWQANRQPAGIRPWLGQPVAQFFDDMKVWTAREHLRPLRCLRK
jgi:hypothetical protein